MGSHKVRIVESSADRQDFMRHLLRDVKALELMIANNMIQSGTTQIGAEQELCFVNQDWSPAMVAMEVLKAIDDPHFVTEYAKFNMEINLDPLFLKGACFSVLERQLNEYLELGSHHANTCNSKILMTGILPTLNISHINLDHMTPLKRYKDLTTMLTRMKGGQFDLRIKGIDELITSHDSSFYEACNTSFQVHYQVSPDDFVDRYNWAQAITAPVLSACTFSPMLFGKRLWRETRIALFEQSIDIRQNHPFRERSARVSFGQDWVKTSIVDLFIEQISRHDLLLCADIDEHSLEMVENGEIPSLAALCTHNGTVYTWNRPCYGVSKGVAHIRIENRIFPSGPTVLDEVANAAFWIGLMHGMPDRYRDIANKLEFDKVKGNFTRAARQGLSAQFEWVDQERITAQHLILDELLPIASSGLKKANVDKADIDRYLSIIEERVHSGKTGSQWMLDTFNGLKRSGQSEEAIYAMTAAMYARQQDGHPVHTWNLPMVDEAGSIRNRFKFVHQIMSRDLFTVKEDGLIEFVVNVMEWKKIRHIPVENNAGELVGLVSSKNLVQYYANRSTKLMESAQVKEIMTKDLITVAPETSIKDALYIMKSSQVGCIPVVQNNKLIGLITEYDFMRVLKYHLDEEDD